MEVDTRPNVQMTQAASAINLAITFSAVSPFLANPSTLTTAHPALHQLRYTTPAGALSDVFVFALPAAHQGTTNEIVQVLKSVEGVRRVDVLEKHMRTKRDEF